MDPTELSQTVVWLDEAHRRDREQLIQLQQRVESLAAELLDQSRLTRELQAQLSSVQTQMGRFGEIQESIEQFKGEIKLLLQKQADEQQRAIRDSQSMRLRDQEAQVKAINELRQQLQEIPHQKEDLALARSEMERLHTSMQSLRQNQDRQRLAVDLQSKPLAFLEEQRRQDAKRLGDLTTEQTELVKKTKAHETRLQILSESAQRSEERLTILGRQGDDLKSEQTRVLEKFLLADQEREQRVNRMAQDWENKSKRMDEFAARMRQFGEQYEEGRRVMAQLANLGEELRREQAQVAELERLFEERQRKQFEEFGSEQERLWKAETLRWELLSDQQEKLKGDFELRQVELDERLKQIGNQIRQLWDLQEAFMGHQSAEMQRWLGEFNDHLTARL